jgi:hypothetical protein
VERIGEKRKAYRILVENLTARDHLGDPGVYGRAILTGMLKK